MTDISISSNKTSDSTLSVPRLRDDGSNWSDYEPRITKALGAKGVWRHILGTAISPKPYTLVGSVPMLADGRTPATEDQIEAREQKIDDFDRKHYLAQHVLLLTISTRLGAKIKNMKTAEEMWNAIKTDATSKSTLFLIDAEDQLASMQCNDANDAKTHLTELKAHFELMTRRRDNLSQMGLSLSDTRFGTMIMGSLPLSYRPALQMISAASKANKTKLMSDELISFFMEEAEPLDT